MKKDIITKDILEQITYDIAKYLLKMDVTKVEFIQQELKSIERREVDLLAKVQIKDQNVLLHIEIQNSNDKKMALRMLRYYQMIRWHYNLPIYQYLIYIAKDKLKMQDSINEPNLFYRYNIVDMKDIPCSELIRLDTPDALVLSILCNFENEKPLDIIVYILKRLKELTDDTNFRRYFLMLETLSENRDLKDLLKKGEQMIRDIDIKKLPSYELGLEDGIKKGIERGKEEMLKKAIYAMVELGLSHKSIASSLDIDIKKVEDLLKDRGV